MRKIVFLGMLMISMVLAAGTNDLLWDYTDAVPASSPDRGLSFGGFVNDGPGEKNGLKGIKLNSSGWCCFTKAPVAGVLKLTFGPRSGINRASLQVHTWTGDQPREETRIGTTCEIRKLGTQCIPLTAEQNKIFITRLLNMEAVLQRIEFSALEGHDFSVEGEEYIPVPCDESKGEEQGFIQEVNIDTLSENARFFLHALAQANIKGDTTIYLPNGVYDLDVLTLTAIEANGIRIIGESKEGTIIRNAPDYRLESISKTATLRIANDIEGTVLENLTIENALDYYKNNNGRAVCLWDQGTKTICRNVRLLSHQDTYYCDCPNGLHYFENCEIHGTVDYICGDGNVYFNRCLLYCERRNRGADPITANKSSESEAGFVFESCTIKSECPIVSLGRSWRNAPKCVFLRTTLDDSAGAFTLEDKGIGRWTLQGMNVLPACFGEYRTMDKDGKEITPKANEVTFTYRGQEKKMNTILTKKQAKVYTMEYVLGEWSKEIKRLIKNK